MSRSKTKPKKTKKVKDNKAKGQYVRKQRDIQLERELRERLPDDYSLRCSLPGCSFGHEHWLFDHEESGRRVVEFWPSSSTWFSRATGRKGTVTVPDLPALVDKIWNELLDAEEAEEAKETEPAKVYRVYDPLSMPQFEPYPPAEQVSIVEGLRSDLAGVTYLVSSIDAVLAGLDELEPVQAEEVAERLADCCRALEQMGDALSPEVDPMRLVAVGT